MTARHHPAQPAEAAHPLESARNLSHELQIAVAQETLDRGIDPYMQQHISDMLTSNGIGPDVVRPEAAPWSYHLEYLRPADWQDVATAADPFFTLWSRTNRRIAECSLGSPDAPYFDRRSLGRRIADEVRMETLPVVLGTTVEALEAAIAEGAFMSSWAMLERGVDYGDIGRTYDDDRKYGLDTYIFGNFGRPHRFYMDGPGGAQSPVIAVLNNEAMRQPGTVITADELQEDEMREMFEGRKTGFRRYLETLALSEDFPTVALAKIYGSAGSPGPAGADGLSRSPRQTVGAFMNGEDSNFNQYGTPSFSTWEVKMPNGTPTSTIERLVFKSEADAHAFHERHGDRWPYEVVPDVAEALRRYQDVFGHSNEDFDTAYEARLAADPRAAKLNELLSRGRDAVIREWFRLHS